MSKDVKDTARLPIHPPYLMIIFLSVALVFGWKLPIPIPFPVWITLIGWLIILCGLGLIFSAFRAMQQVNTSVDPRTPTTQIVTSGPYQFSRNPIYLGYVAQVVGIPLILGTYWGLILSPMVLDAYNRLIIEREETYLTNKFGQIYLDYLSKVRRWI